MSQIYDPIDQGSDSGSEGWQNLENRTDTLRSSFSGPTAPAAPVPGQPWYDTDNEVLYYYDGAGWVEVGTVLASDVDYALNQAINMRLENTAAVPTPATGNIGYAILDTGVGKVRVVVSATKIETVVSLSSADFQSVPLPLRSWVKDATDPPTDVQVGLFDGWLFDDTLKKMRTSVRLPRGYDTAADAVLRVHYLLNAAESSGDVLDATLDYAALALDSADAGTKTPTTKAATGQTIGSNAGLHTYHTCDIPLAFADVSNPLSAGALLSLEWSLAAVTSVTGAIVVDAELLSPVGLLGITEIA